MRSFFTNMLFAGASIALTASIVVASATPAAAAMQTADAPRAVVRYSDLNLRDNGGRAELDARIRSAAEQVCPADSNADLDALRCRGKAIAQAHRDIAELLASRSPAPVQNAAP